MNVDNGLYLGIPFLARVRGLDVIGGSKAVRDEEGQLIAVVNTTFPVSALLQQFGYLGRFGANTIFLFRNDQVGLIREPDIQGFRGRKSPNALIFQNYPRLPHGRFEGAAATDGIRRVGVHQSLAPWPLVMGASLEIKGVEIESSTADNLAQTAFGALILSIMVFAAFSVWAYRTAGEERDRAVKALADLAAALEEQKELRAAAEGADKAKSAFLATMSHELRSPLNAIIGFSEAITERHIAISNTEKVYDYLNHIRSSGLHLLSLINDILDLSSIKGGSQLGLSESVSIPPLVDSVVKMCAHRAEAGRVKIRVVDAQGDAPILSDRRAVLQILLNLTVNAIKFSPRDGVVEISTVGHPECVEIVIRDSGPGMSESMIAKIGTPFLKTDNPTVATEGTGLGLSIVTELLVALGGHATYRNLEPIGFEVRVEIPRSYASSSEATRHAV